MRAAVFDRYGGPEVVAVRELATPTPGSRQVRVRVAVSAVTVGDARVRALRVPAGFRLPTRLMFGWSRPRVRVLGMDAVGVVDAVGDWVHAFSVGQRVVVSSSSFGAHAEQLLIAERGAIVPLPDGIDAAAAVAVVFGGVTALHFLDRASLRAGERVLVVGASGSVGTAAVQLARLRGAHVTGVCSAANAALVRSLGADEVLDYRAPDHLRDGRTFDVVLDAVGTLPWRAARRVLAPGGRLLAAVTTLPQLLGATLLPRRARGRRVVAGVATATPERLQQLVALVGDGSLLPVIGARLPLERIVEAHRLVDTGHKIGNVVVDIGDGG